ncbi:uncharacterized protein LOC123642159 [Lemur catta]|uniref:uncharacterized protein LOC123642159 n=1 Tax=Lemur catta TaxID=9447 RepID=UPI001E266C31|nr:uncharacterized protein LOC123642159 [Lemur catta]
MQPVEKQNPEDPQISKEPSTEVTGSPWASYCSLQGRQEGWRKFLCLGGGLSPDCHTPASRCWGVQAQGRKDRHRRFQSWSAPLRLLHTFYHHFLHGPPSSEQKLSLQPEPTVTFLLTLLSTSEPTEPKDLDSDLEIQEYRFLDQEDWGPQRTSKEIRHLQNDCMRLRESLSSTQMDNLVLGEKLQNLPTLLYQSLKEGAQAIQEEVKVIQEEVKAIQEEAQALFQHPSSQNVALLLMPPDQPHDQRDKSQPWLGPRPESRHLLGRLYHQLVPL